MIIAFLKETLFEVLKTNEVQGVGGVLVAKDRDALTEYLDKYSSVLTYNDLDDYVIFEIKELPL